LKSNNILSQKAKVAIGVGVSLGLIMIIIIAAIFRRLQAHRNPHPELPTQTQDYEAASPDCHEEKLKSGPNAPKQNKIDWPETSPELEAYIAPTELPYSALTELPAIERPVELAARDPNESKEICD
jgi:hypothetical protein